MPLLKNGVRENTRDGISSPASTLDVLESAQSENSPDHSKAERNVLRDSLDIGDGDGGTTVLSVPPNIPDFHNEEERTMSSSSGNGQEHAASLTISGEDKTLVLLRNIVDGADGHVSNHEITDSGTRNCCDVQNDLPNCDANSKSLGHAHRAQTSRLSSRNFQFSVAGRCLSAVSYNVTHSRWGRRVFRRHACDVPESIEVEHLPKGARDQEEENFFCAPDSPSFASDDDLFQGFVLRQEDEINSLDGSCSMNASRHSFSETSQDETEKSGVSQSIAEKAPPRVRREMTESDKSLIKNNQLKEDITDWCGQEERIHSTVKGSQENSHEVAIVEANQCVAPSPLNLNGSPSPTNPQASPSLTKDYGSPPPIQDYGAPSPIKDHGSAYLMQPRHSLESEFTTELRA